MLNERQVELGEGPDEVQVNRDLLVLQQGSKQVQLALFDVLIQVAESRLREQGPRGLTFCAEACRCW